MLDLQDLEQSAFSEPFQEEPCISLGGTCKKTVDGCSGGEFLIDKCPNQDNTIRCCISGKTKTSL